MTIIELGKRFKSHFGFNPPIDMIMTWVAGPTNAQLDIIKLDDEFARRDPEYNPEQCTYKEQTDVSTAMYVEQKFGKEAVEFLNNQLKSKL